MSALTDYVDNLVDSVASGLRSAISAVSKAINTVWTTSTAFWRKVGTAETTLRSDVTNWVTSEARAIGAVSTTLKWLKTTYIGREITAAGNAIRTWTGRLVADAENLAKAGISDLRSWVTTGIHEIDAAIADVRSWALDQVNSIITRLKRIESHVFGELSTPERLAAWLLQAMVSELTKYVADNLDAVAEYVWAHRMALITKSTDRLEEWISRIL